MDRGRRVGEVNIRIEMMLWVSGEGKRRDNRSRITTGRKVKANSGTGSFEEGWRKNKNDEQQELS